MRPSARSHRLPSGPPAPGLDQPRECPTDAPGMEEERAFSEQSAQLRTRRPAEVPGGGEHARPRSVLGERLHDATRLRQQLVPPPREGRRVGGFPGKGKLSDLFTRIAARARRVLQYRRGVEARVLAAGGPRQEPQWLDAVVALDDVNPVPNLQAADEGENLVGCQVEGMQGQAQLVVAQEREETICAVPRPLHPDRILVTHHLRFDERWALPHRPHAEAVLLEQAPVGNPARLQRLLGVVEEIDVAGYPGSRHQLVEGHASGDIALAGVDAVPGYEPADGALELCESHRLSSAARR